MKKIKKYLFLFSLISFFLFKNTISFAQNDEILKVLELIQKDLKTLEKAVYSDNSDLSIGTTNQETKSNYSEEALTRHLLKLSDIEKQFQELTNKFEEVNFKIDKLSNRLSKIQSDNQLRFQELEEIKSKNFNSESIAKTNQAELPGSSQPQDLGSISQNEVSNTEIVQKTQSIETTTSVVTEEFKSEEEILPSGSPEEQYEFATSFLKVGDYDTAEVALKEFVNKNINHDLAGNAQYWYAETFRIRQLFTDAASAYLEGYQKYPKSEKAPINLLKLGVSLVQIGEKDQGCSMISGVSKQYPKASQSVLQKAKYEEKKFGCPIKQT
tara:strand:+ start:1340 stop:2317 length:978 start_codon:yes stop_codon:yes gene_type:complete